MTVDAYSRPYITYHNGVLAVVRCKGACETILAARRGLAQNLRMDRTNSYTELVLEMRLPNGLLGKHETAVCRSCRERILAGGARPNELLDIYRQDVNQWIASATTAAKPRLTRAAAEREASRFASFVPVRALDERGRGDRNFI